MLSTSGPGVCLTTSAEIEVTVGAISCILPSFPFPAGGSAARFAAFALFFLPALGATWCTLESNMGIDMDSARHAKHGALPHALLIIQEGWPPYIQGVGLDR